MILSRRHALRDRPPIRLRAMLPPPMNEISTEVEV